MATTPRTDWESLAALVQTASTAARYVAEGTPDDHVTLPVMCPVFPTETSDEDELRSIPAIDVLRYFVDNYDQARA